MSYVDNQHIYFSFFGFFRTRLKGARRIGKNFHNYWMLGIFTFLLLVTSVPSHAIPVYFIGQVVTSEGTPVVGADTAVRFFLKDDPGLRFPDGSFLISTTDSNGLFVVAGNPNNLDLYDQVSVFVNGTSLTNPSIDSFTTVFAGVEIGLSLEGILGAAGIPTSLNGAALSLVQSVLGVPSIVLSTDLINQGTAGVLVVPNNPVPVPAAIWLFGSGMIGLLGIARRKKPI